MLMLVNEVLLYLVYAFLDLIFRELEKLYVEDVAEVADELLALINLLSLEVVDSDEGLQNGHWLLCCQLMTNDMIPDNKSIVIVC